METVQSDEDAASQSRAHGQPDVADDVDEPEAQREGAGTVRLKIPQEVPPSVLCEFSANDMSYDQVKTTNGREYTIRDCKVARGR